MLLQFDELDSTSSYLKANCAGMPQFAVVTAGFQTSGRGQRGNSWESEEGKNLLMSMLFYPPSDLAPASQFLISKAVSLAVTDTVVSFIGKAADNTEEVTVKWPNDIYIGDRKVAGILIEHSLSSPDRIDHTVIGIGLNVNQRKFHSNAPNPTSLILHCPGIADIPVADVLRHLSGRLSERLSGLSSGSPANLDVEYRSRLWRRSGFHPYVALVASCAPAPTAVKSADLNAGGLYAADLHAGDKFMAEIVDVATDGMLTLRLPDTSTLTFRFKELAPVIE